MQDEQELFSRRHFLQWTATGAASAGAQSLLPRASAQPASSGAAPRTAPAHTLQLGSPDLRVTLDAGTGLPYEYHLRKNDSRLRGEDLGEPIQVTLCNIREIPVDLL